jgi:L-fuconate dehydratase
MKVGLDADADVSRAALIREHIGPDTKLMMDANQWWDVPTAIERIRQLAPFDPHWMEEPTSPDDVLGHAEIARQVAPIKLATGEMAQNRVTFKQLLQEMPITAQVHAVLYGGRSPSDAIKELLARQLR